MCLGVFLSKRDFASSFLPSSCHSVSHRPSSHPVSLDSDLTQLTSCLRFLFHVSAFLLEFMLWKAAGGREGERGGGAGGERESVPVSLAPPEWCGAADLVGGG